MNNAFKTWTRSTAFSIQLHEGAINELLFLRHADIDCETHGRDLKQYPRLYDGERSLLGYLLRRGLVEPSQDRGGFVMTKAGRLTADLLHEAGFVGRHHQNATMFPTS